MQVIVSYPLLESQSSLPSPPLTARCLSRVTDWSRETGCFMDGSTKLRGRILAHLSHLNLWISTFLICKMWDFVGTKLSQRSLFILRLWIQVTWSWIECSFCYDLFFWGNRKLLLLGNQYKSDFKKRSIHMYFVGSILCNRTNNTANLWTPEASKCKRKVKDQIIWLLFLCHKE